MLALKDDFAIWAKVCARNNPVISVLLSIKTEGPETEQASSQDTTVRLTGLIPTGPSDQ